MNLWQRCEALGPMEDQGVSLYRTDSGDYRIFIDRATVFHVHQDGTIGDYCRAWLADAILQRFEAITKQGGTVLTKENVVKEVTRMYSEIPQPMEPTYEQRKRLYGLIYASNGMGNSEFEVSVDSVPKVFLRRKSDGRSMCAISPSKYDYAFINGGISFETACATVGMNIDNPTQPTEDQYKQLYDYVLSGKAGEKGFTIKMHNRFAKEPEITVEWPVHPRRGFSIKPKSFYGYHDINGGRQLTFADACEWVGMTPELPTPEILPEPTYIVEAPKPTEPTQEQLRDVVAYVRKNPELLWAKNVESSELEETTGDTGLRLRSIKPPMLAVIEESSPSLINFRCNMPFDDLCRLIGFNNKDVQVTRIPTEQWVFEEPQQFVSIPVQDWQQLRQSLTTMQSILFPEIQPVEFEQ